MRHLTCSGLSILDVGGKLAPSLHNRDQVTTAESVIDLSYTDGAFDCVLCVDVIAGLQEKQHRLAISELNRLIKPDGMVLFATPLDTKTYNAPAAFLALVRTEFELVERELCYQRLSDYLRLPRRVKFFEWLSERVWGTQGATHLIAIARKKRFW